MEQRSLGEIWRIKTFILTLFWNSKTWTLWSGKPVLSKKNHLVYKTMYMPLPSHCPGNYLKICVLNSDVHFHDAVTLYTFWLWQQVPGAMHQSAGGAIVSTAIPSTAMVPAGPVTGSQPVAIRPNQTVVSLASRPPLVTIPQTAAMPTAPQSVAPGELAWYWTQCMENEL